MRTARASAAQLVSDLQAELDGIIAAQKADPPDDEHDVEGSSVGFERARITALLEQATASLRALDSAVERMAAGTFGRCEVCGGAVGEARLEAMPATRKCIDCARSSAPGGGRAPLHG